MGYKVKFGYVYLIQSILKPERVYIGSTVSWCKRRSHHRRALEMDKHRNPCLQAHFNKYGGGDLVFEVIEQFSFICQQHLLSREQGWCYHFEYKNTNKPYFNIALITGSGMLGAKHTEETKLKIGEASKGKINSNETRKKMSNSKKGIPFSEEHKQSLVDAHVDMRGHKNPFFGKKHTEQTKKTISIKNKGRKQSMAERAKRSIATQKRWDNTPTEVRKKHGEKMKGNKYREGVSWSVEEREKRSILLSKRWKEVKSNGKKNISGNSV